MSKVQRVEKDVKSMNREELAEFREWFLDFDAEAWDGQIEQDAEAGRLDRFADEALRQHERGDSKPL